MRTRKLALTIDTAVSTTVSSAQLIADVSINGIQWPSSWTSSGDIADPSVTVQTIPITDQSGTVAAPAEADWNTMVEESGAPISIRVQAGKVTVLSGIELSALLAAHWVRFVSDVAQASNRTINLLGVQGK